MINPVEHQLAYDSTALPSLPKSQRNTQIILRASAEIDISKSVRTQGIEASTRPANTHIPQTIPD